MSFRDNFPVFSCWAGKKRYLMKTFFYRKNPVKWTIKEYKKRYGIVLNLDTPSSFYEKMNYWKHYCYSDIQTTLADKLEVKKYLSNLGFGDLCAKCLFSSDNVKDLKKWIKDNSNNVKRFVVKTNHSCGDVYIYENGKITKKNGRNIKNLNTMYKMLNIGLHYNHYYTFFEVPYKNIKPRVFVEEYIDFNESTIEYEIMCNYGSVIASKIVKNRQNSSHAAATVDSNFKVINVNIGFKIGDIVSPPIHFDIIKNILNKTCMKMPFCRADFIETNGKLYFCEFTFVKSGGMDLYEPKEFNKEIGEMFKL